MWTDETLAKLDLRTFKPPAWMGGPLRQTIIPYYIPFKEKPAPGTHHKVTMCDGDTLVVNVNKPDKWRSGDRVIMMIHGLAGREESPYLVRSGRKLYDLGYLVVKVNLRSCGPGRGLAKKPYHSGQSQDTRQGNSCRNHRHSRSQLLNLHSADSQ